MTKARDEKNSTIKTSDSASLLLGEQMAKPLETWLTRGKLASVVSEGSLSHLSSLRLSSSRFALAASINNSLLLMRSLSPLCASFFGPKRRPPLLILRRQRRFDEFCLNEGDVKKQLSYCCFLIADVVKSRT